MVCGALDKLKDLEYDENVPISSLGRKRTDRQDLVNVFCTFPCPAMRVPE